VTPLLVALGAGVGAALRFLTAHHLDRHDGGFPWGTLIVNVLGSFVLGLCSGQALDGHALAFLGIGFCGGLTTYSAFAVQTHARGPLRGATYAVATIVLALAACALGFVVGQPIVQA
jgi:CrcB protein